jgi:cytochrome P450
VFDHADTFDVARSPNPHVSFGYGPHFCPGARFSAFVMRIFFEEFLGSMADLHVEGDVIHTRSFWMNRIRSMPVAMSRRADSCAAPCSTIAVDHRVRSLLEPSNE